MNPYNVYVTTSNIPNAGTDASVYIVFIGEVYGIPRQSDKILLKKSKTNSNDFEKGQTDLFQIKCPEIGRLKKIRIGHDNKGFGAGWHLDKVVIESLADNKTWICECNRWLAKDEEDGKIERELVCVEKSTHNSNIDRDRQPQNRPLKENRSDFADPFLDKFSVSNKKYIPNDNLNKIETYRVIFTNSEQNVPDIEPNLLIQLFGTRNQTEKIQLRKVKKKKFDNLALTYDLELPYIGEIESIKVGLDGSRPTLGWHIGDVIIRTPDTNPITFKCNNWLDFKQGDKFAEKELFPSKSPRKSKDTLYRIYVKTSSVKNAGTDANVYCQIFGEDMDTGRLQLNSSKTYKNKFEEGNEDIFEIRAPDVGEIKILRIGHDNTGFGPGWHLKDVIIETDSGRKYTFPCNEWFAKDEGDKKLERDLYPLEEIREKTNKKHLMIGNQQTYHVYVKTSDIINAGTDANVFIKIYGEYNKSEKVLLEKSETHKNKFERGNEDRFTIEDLYYGDIHEIKIGHDNKGIGAGWHLNEVIIENTAEDKRWIFPCNRWLDEKEEDGKLEVKLTPIKTNSRIYSKKKKYEIDVYTGDVDNGGTDAEVFLTMYGKNGETSEIHLNKSKTHWNKFEKHNADTNTKKYNFAQMDQFEVEENDLGQLYCIRIRHDNSGFKPSWYLERIEITDLDENKKYYFICKKWLSVTRDDQRIERIIKELNYEPENEYKISYRRPNLKKKRSKDKDKKLPVKYYNNINNHSYLINSPKKYFVKFYTSKKQNIFGTDMNVFVRIFGDYAITKEHKLKTELTNQKCSKTNEEKYLKNNVDLFIIESLDDIGTIYAIELRLGQCKSFFERTNDLHIHKVEVLDGVFTYEFEFDESVSIRNINDDKSHLVDKKIILLEKSALF